MSAHILPHSVVMRMEREDAYVRALFTMQSTVNVRDQFLTYLYTCYTYILIYLYKYTYILIYL